MQENNKNIILATMISMVILIGWTWFYEKPRIEREESQRKAALEQKIIQEKTGRKYSNSASNSSTARVPANRGYSQKLSPNSKDQGPVIVALKSRSQILDESKRLRVKIKSDQLHGSIYLKGARFDDLTLAQYFEKIDKEQEVVLFAPTKSKNRYFADFGWVSSSDKINLPTPNTVWRSKSRELTPQKPITLFWRNRQNIHFEIEISMDENFMFFVKQKVKNLSRREISVANYGRINRAKNNLGKANYILHEGFLGVFNNILEEYTYKDSIEDGVQNFNSTGSTWLGITDKYWLSAMIADRGFDYKSTFAHKNSNNSSIFNSEFISQEFAVPRGSELVFEHKLFAGAKKVKQLDHYANQYDIKLFDRAIDFGWFYFLTKPFFFMIDFIYKFLGNFGLAILVMTIMIKAALFPMASKSYRAIAKMKKLQPKMTEIRAKHKDDKLAMNREIMDMYKREKVNPASGCLPILLQIPIFFSLYKVIFVTLDMRHAPFYGWVSDLSVPDPTSIFNLFGLLPFETAGIFAIGAWPVLMGVTMYLQQKLSPPAADATQAKVMKYMPYVLTFVLASFPAGLVIYWTWNNLLSILQQLYITKKVNKEQS